MRALVVVDYQNDFITGNIGSRDTKSIEDRICDRVSKYL